MLHCPAAASTLPEDACTSQRWHANLWPVKMYISQLQLGAGTHTHTQLLKHAVEWSDAEETICCPAIKRHPHKDGAVANVKEIKATANHRQKRWSTAARSTLHFRAAHSIWIYSPRWPSRGCSAGAGNWNRQSHAQAKQFVSAVSKHLFVWFVSFCARWIKQMKVKFRRHVEGGLPL